MAKICGYKYECLVSEFHFVSLLRGDVLLNVKVYLSLCTQCRHMGGGGGGGTASPILNLGSRGG